MALAMGSVVGNESSIRISNAKNMFFLRLYDLGLMRAEIGSIVPLGRGHFLMIPGTACLATIVPSLRDKSHSPFDVPRIGLAVRGKTPGESWCLLRVPIWFRS